MADRFFVPRLDAIRAWSVSNQSVVISSHFLLSVLINQRIIDSDNVIIRHYVNNQNPHCYVSLNRVTRETNIGECFYSESINNPTWSANPYFAAEEVALMRSLRNLFPQLTMGIVSPAELPPSFSTNVKTFCFSFYRVVKGFLQSCFTKEEQVPSTLTITNPNDYISNSNNIANIPIISDASNNLNSNVNSNVSSNANDITKTIPLIDKTISYYQEQLSLDIDDSQLKVDSKNLNTSHIN